MEYEINFLVLQSQTEKLDEARKEVEKAIKDQNGTVTENRFYKKRKLAYKINHEQYGFFNVLRFTLKNNGKIKELKKELNLLKETARYIIVKADELPSLTTPEEDKTSKEKKTIKKEEVAKIIAKKEKTVTKKELKPKSEERTDQKKKALSKKESELNKKTDIKVSTKKKEVDNKKDSSKKEAEEKSSDKKTSLEDLDKKLDEILSI